MALVFNECPLCGSIPNASYDESWHRYRISLVFIQDPSPWFWLPCFGINVHTADVMKHHWKQSTLFQKTSMEYISKDNAGAWRTKPFCRSTFWMNHFLKKLAEFDPGISQMCWLEKDAQIIQSVLATFGNGNQNIFKIVLKFRTCKF